MKVSRYLTTSASTTPFKLIHKISREKKRISDELYRFNLKIGDEIETDQITAKYIKILYQSKWNSIMLYHFDYLSTEKDNNHVPPVLADKNYLKEII